MRDLKASFVSLFPTQIITGEEGKNLIAKIDKELNPPLREGMLAPPFTLKDIEGKFVQLSDFRNKYVLIDFWASWCPPCRKNNPLLKEIYNDYNAQNFEIVSISVDNNLDDWKTAVLKDQLIWTNLSDYKTENKGAAFNFNVSSFPHYFLVDPDGKVLLNGGSELGQVKTKLREIFKTN
ncbi:TlpA disulfide reductase family protein [Paraflavitalea sp. CAU 1676]|uniref:TlpA family protein disulfide reductase n=1 Tax=Paraflavitalea sp. CAU 1676 TaxID=3032598 RepID=UPI0023DCE6AE|nr:TlpA disulfide reductase family protein [Paraflavitalea sp. CAU 1676]MDF2189130.1 TlpA disulfide reductase family protein [Paraflavitalea sp. CAU 1676]